MEKTKERAGIVRAFKPSLGAVESGALKEAVESGWLGTGIYTRLFEARLADEVGARLALATNSGISALHLALKVLPVEGGEVITTPVTSVATNHAILYNNAVPVFCDVEPDTGNIDPDRIIPLINRKTRAIVAVHLGHACDMDPILEMARRKGLFVVEDACACHAVGGFYKDRPLGSLGDIAAFSFGRFKGITTLDGGALVHDRKDWHGRLTRLRRLGHAEQGGGMAEGSEGVEELGFHYRMSDLAAVLGLAQLKRREWIQGRLDAVMERYRKGLRDVSFLEVLEPKPYSRGVRACAAVNVFGGRRDRLRRFLKNNGIQVNDNLYPNHLYGLYKPYRCRLPVAEKFCSQTLHLPYYPDLQDEEADFILEVIRRFKG